MPGSVTPGPHAVKRIVAGASTRHFCYDANGNQLSSWNFTRARARTVAYTPYNMPKTITEAGQNVTFAYGADRSRFKQVNGFTGETTLYVDGIYEKEIVGSTWTHTHYIVAGGQQVAIYKSRNDGVQSTRYLHRDHLGSITHITNESGTLVESLSYDPWGKRRNSNWSNAPGPIFPAETPRGYTGHEHLDDVTVVHMNGRAYDPDTARMLSADPYVQSPRYSQSFNRYSYVLNNPLRYTDPSGFCIAAGPSCGGFMPGLGGSSPAPPASPTYFAGAYEYGGRGRVTMIVPEFHFPGTGGFSSFGSGMCIVAGCGPGLHFTFGGTDILVGGHSMPYATISIYTFYVSDYHIYTGSPAYGPINTFVSNSWLGKLWGRPTSSRGGQTASPMLGAFNGLKQILRRIGVGAPATEAELMSAKLAAHQEWNATYRTVDELMQGLRPGDVFFGKRPLGKWSARPWDSIVIYPRVLAVDASNVEYLHEELFYVDNAGRLRSRGFHEMGDVDGVVRSDPGFPANIGWYRFGPITRNVDIDSLDFRSERFMPGKYDLIENNCQDYCTFDVPPLSVAGRSRVVRHCNDLDGQLLCILGRRQPAQ